MSNLILLVCVIAGLLLGFFSKSGSSKVHGLVLNATILVLLFFMGAILGFAPDLPARIKGYGLNALVIIIFACGGSAIVTAILVKVFKKC